MSAAIDYDSFVASKMRRKLSQGFEPREIRAPLFDWQKHVVTWAVRQGRCALFEDCGLGKTPQQLEWAHQVAEHTGLPVLLLTPLAVAHQTEREAQKFGYCGVGVARDGGELSRITITNYERLAHFDPQAFGGVVLDESSILKNFTGKMRKALTDAFRETPYRLCCTATPSPNDYTEFGQHADFLGVCTPAQMLCTYFINDTFNTGDWRLKRHAEAEFWKWVASWAACVSKPSDIGFSDEGYILPPLRLETVTVDVDIVNQKPADELFRVATLSATTMHKEMRLTAPDRAAKVAELVNGSLDPWIVWCNTNTEADELRARIADAIEVRGDDTPAEKERLLSAFTDGHARVIITKPSIAGMGLNWQHCCNVVFVGLSYSFEEFYQALRRSYRFGQREAVNAYIVQAATEGAILQAVQVKMAAHERMQQAMKQAAAYLKKNTHEETVMMKTDITTATGADWTMHHGDCVRVARTLPPQSIDFAVFSPPFADLFTYSADVQDMGNCADVDEFIRHFEILVSELARVMTPGREVAVHCVDLLATKWKHGAIEFQDFSGEIIRAFRRHGFRNHSRITIWKSPVTEMQRTKAHGLLYKTLCADSADSRVGAPDYLLVFRALGENPKPITKDKANYPVDWWQEVASPVWMTVDQGNVLNREGARDAADEKHICPLQLDVIERAITLWSNPGDVVYSPFAGIGSEGFQALKLGRRFVGSELKESYFKQACANLNNAGAQLDLFAKGAA